MTQTNTLLKLTLLYTLKKTPVAILDKILARELLFEEKLDVLLSLSEERVKTILLNLGAERI